MSQNPDRVAAPTPETPLTHQFNLSAIRKWVDEGFAKWAKQSGLTAPNGFAGEAAAAVWLHAQSLLAGAVSHPQPEVQTTTKDDEEDHARGGTTGSQESSRTAGSDAGLQDDCAGTRDGRRWCWRCLDCNAWILNEGRGKFQCGQCGTIKPMAQTLVMYDRPVPAKLACVVCGRPFVVHDAKWTRCVDCAWRR